MRTAAQPPSPFAQGVMMAGGVAWIYALFVAISAATGHRFEISGDGVEQGVPLPATWFHAALFTALGAALWLLGRRWDATGFVLLRKRRPWLVPTVGVVLLLPASLMLIFVLVR
jgi:hypothetical protein